jgi:hypothetical protein
MILQLLSSIPQHVHSVDAAAFRASLRSLHETSAAERGALKERVLDPWAIAALVRRAIAKSTQWKLQSGRIVRSVDFNPN